MDEKSILQNPIMKGRWDERYYVVAYKTSEDAPVEHAFICAKSKKEAYERVMENHLMRPYVAWVVMAKFVSGKIVRFDTNEKNPF